MAVTSCTVSDVSSASILNQNLNALLLALLLGGGGGLSSNAVLNALLGVPTPSLSGLGGLSLSGLGGLSGLGIPSTNLLGNPSLLSLLCKR